MKKMNNKGFTNGSAHRRRDHRCINAITILCLPTSLKKQECCVCANIRSAYAEAQVAYLFGESDGNVTNKICQVSRQLS